MSAFCDKAAANPARGCVTSGRKENSKVAKERKKAYKMHGALLVFQRHLGSSCRLVKREKRAPLVVRVE